MHRTYSGTENIMGPKRSVTHFVLIDFPMQFDAVRMRLEIIY